MLGALVQVIGGTIAQQSAIENLLRSCARDEPKDAALARRAQQISAALAELAMRLEALPPSAVVIETQALVHYHQRMVLESTRLAFAVRSVPLEQRACFASHDLGTPAERLRQLHRTLAEALGSRGGEGAADADLLDGLLGIVPGADTPSAPGRWRSVGLWAGWPVPFAGWHERVGVGVAPSGLIRAVDNLVCLASLSCGMLAPTIAWCDPASVLRAAIDELGPNLLRDRAVGLDASPGGWTPRGLVACDAALLQRAVANLVDDALRRTAPSRRLILSATTGADLTIELRNSSTCPQLAERRVRARPRQRHALGLATTVAIVRALGGEAGLGPDRDGVHYVLRLPVEPRRRRGALGREVEPLAEVRARRGRQLGHRTMPASSRGTRRDRFR